LNGFREIVVQVSYKTRSFWQWLFRQSGTEHINFIHAQGEISKSIVNVDDYSIEGNVYRSWYLRIDWVNPVTNLHYPAHINHGLTQMAHLSEDELSGFKDALKEEIGISFQN